jgi:phage tail-like protein
MSYYPPVGFHFKVEFRDVPGLAQRDTYFQDVSGLSRELGSESVNSGGENRFSFKLPTRAQYPNLVLKRGLWVDSKLIAWATNAIEHFDIQTSTVVVTLLNEKHEPLQTYECIHAWPQKWNISNFNAEENKLVIETIELAYQYFRIVN